MAQCRFKGADGVCNCKAGERGKAFECTNEKRCTLRQTKEEQMKSLHKAWARFTALSVSGQTMYKNLYYGGRYPWEVYTDDCDSR